MTRAREAAGGDADLAAVGALLAEPARARILQALLDGRALPAGVLAAEAGVAASTASGHLGRLAPIVHEKSEVGVDAIDRVA